ncbi:hypothetical protein Vi05172_g10003 [Venturia inaequalis]|nr:hypothetical protein Vi05172_g10003 [Venturia inaequalis]
MQFLSITAVVLNLVLLQNVAAQKCNGIFEPSPCQEIPCNTLFNKPLDVCARGCPGTNRATCCSGNIFCWTQPGVMTRLV